MNGIKILQLADYWTVVGDVSVSGHLVTVRRCFCLTRRRDGDTFGCSIKQPKNYKVDPQGVTQFDIGMVVMAIDCDVDIWEPILADHPHHERSK